LDTVAPGSSLNVSADQQAPEAKTVLGRALLDAFFVDPECRYLNHGAYGAVSRPVAETATNLRYRIETQPSRFLSEDLPGMIRHSANRLGEFVGARGEDLVFVSNATTAMNAVLRSLVLLPGDEVLTTKHVYGAVARTLEFVCERSGARLVHADIPFPATSPEDLTNAVLSAVTGRTRLIVVDHVTSPSALVMPVREITDFASDRGIQVLVDGAHGPGMLPLHIDELNATWYAGNCHKWLGTPRGCGFLWTKPSRQALVRPTTISHGVGMSYHEAFDWPGTIDFTPWLCIDAALEFRASIGEKRINTHCLKTIRKGAKLVANSVGGELGGTRQLMSFMAAVRLPMKRKASKRDAGTLRSVLRHRHQIEVSTECIDDVIWMRLCAYVYNEISDFEALASVLPDTLESL